MMIYFCFKAIMNHMDINRWVYGPRHSDYHYTLFRPNMTGGPPHKTFIESLVDETVEKGFPTPTDANDIKLKYNNQTVFSMPDGNEVLTIPYFDFDPDNALIWVV